MTEKTAPWWRSFVGKRRKAARESASILEQELSAHLESNQQHVSIGTTPVQKSTSVCSSAQAAGGQDAQADDTYDDSVVQPTFSENADRRKLLVTRSGRFKEKRRKRVGLPENYEDTTRAEPPRKGSTN